MRRVSFLLCATITLLPATDVAAQAAASRYTPIRWGQEFPSEPSDGPSLFHRITSGVGTALLGAGLGFMASQIVQGDWDDADSGSPIDRTQWAVVGGSLGFAVGVSFPVFGRSGTLGRGGLPGGRQHLGPGELRKRRSGTAYDAVSALRPEWLQIRGSRSLTPGLDPVVVDGTGGVAVVSGTTPLTDESDAIQIYVDYVRVGGLEQLRNVDVANVQDIYFFDAAQATQRFGGGNPHGAILVLT
jgi:hypothetical protein